MCILLAIVISLPVFMTGCQRKGSDTMWFQYPTVKILKTDKRGKLDTYKLYIAKNEYEGFQFAVKYQDDHELKVSMTDYTDKNGNTIESTIYLEKFVPCTYAEPFFQKSDKTGQSVNYPDGLAPVNEGIQAYINETIPFYVLCHTTKDTVPGDYTATITVCDGEEILDQQEVSAHVWNFTMPDTPYVTTASDLSWEYLRKVCKPENNDASELYLQYYDFLLEHHMCAYSLPYDILDERADSYMSDPRVTSFRIPYSYDDNVITAYYNKLSSNPEWMKKGYFYPLDEPSTVESYEQLHAIGERLGRLFPGYRLVSPFFVNPDINETQDAIDYVSDVMNIWCPKLFCFDSAKLYNEKQLKTKKSFADRMKEERKGGDDVWWYVCWEPGEPYSNLYVNMQGIKHRSMFWQAYQYDVNGFLYWCSNYWKYTPDPWSSAQTVKWLTDYVYGDGSLLYNGEKYNYNGPCSSLRLEAVRDGIDDFGYIMLAKEAGMSDKDLNSKVSKIAKSIYDYTNDDSLLMKVRKELGDYIEKKSAK